MVSGVRYDGYLTEYAKSGLLLIIAQLKNMQTSQTISSCMHDQMLESNRDDVKLEAMRCVTVMTAKGKLTVPRTLFPHIVKNVSSKNPELRKLIYLYLTNFADQEPDLALLPVASLQKSLKSPNPLVRSSALKVLTSMRLSILSAIFIATLRNSVNDLSPYVRKTVAHSIIKIFRLDPSLRPELIEYIERLFNDKNSMVLSSAVAAFEVVCPERLDLIEKHYRRFCFILADCNEWGQTLMLKILMRSIIYGSKKKKTSDLPTELDPKILLRSAKPLVHSNNSAVVLAVIRVFIAIATYNEVRSTITRPLIRLLYSHREIQLVVLKIIEDLITSGRTDIDGLDNIDYEPDRQSQDQSQEESGANDVISSESEVDDDSEDETDESEDDDDDATDSSDDDEDENSEQEEEKEEEEKDEETEKKANNNSVRANESDESQENVEKVTSEKKDDKTVVIESTCDANATTEKDINSLVDKKASIKINDMGNETMNTNVKSTTAKNADAYCEVFRPYIKSFYIKHHDCTQIRLLKLKILTRLSCSVNVSQVLRELQAYILAYVDDKEFVSASIHAIGRCSLIVKEVAPTCLNGLTSLLSNNNEHVVSEAIVVLRSQIINKKLCKSSPKKTSEPASDLDMSNDSQHEDDDKIVSTVIKQVTKLLPKVTAPQARATILWILAEFHDKNATAVKSTPNVLRLIAKSFCQEDNFVKLQSLTLVSKFLLFIDKEKKPELTNKIRAFASYLFNLAKYDINHDVRDRGRFLKKLLENEELCAKVLHLSDTPERSNRLQVAV